MLPYSAVVNSSLEKPGNSGDISGMKSDLCESGVLTNWFGDIAVADSSRLKREAEPLTAAATVVPALNKRSSSSSDEIIAMKSRTSREQQQQQTHDLLSARGQCTRRHCCCCCSSLCQVLRCRKHSNQWEEQQATLSGHQQEQQRHQILASRCRNSNIDILNAQSWMLHE